MLCLAALLCGGSKPLNVPPSNSPLFEPVGNVPGTVEERDPNVE